MRQRGFGLVSAIFIIVVVAAVAAYMLQVSTVQLGTVSRGVSGERAYWAAQGGIQWAVRYVQANATGNSHSDATQFCGTDIDGTTLDVNGYTVAMSCTAYLFSDPQDRSIYHVTATASRGAPGSRDYVSRAVRASFAQPAP